MYRINGSKSYLLFLLMAVASLLSSCFHRMVPTSSGGQCNQKENVMVYTVTPYGSVSLPGKWMVGKYAKASGQQYFYRSDTTTMIVVINTCASQSFAKGADGYEFVKRYYDMEVKFQGQLLEQTPQLLIDNKDKKYMLWKVHADGIDQYSICGVKDCACGECVYNLLTLKTRKVTEQQAITMLQDILLTRE